MKPVKYLTMAAAAALLWLAPMSPAGANVQKEGTWPEEEKKVSFDFDGKPSAGIQKLGKEAGWSLVVSDGIAIDEHDVKIRVQDQPADAVLDALFEQSNVVAKRNGTLVTVLPVKAEKVEKVVEAPAPAAVAPPVPTVRGEDRSAVGSSVHVHKGETVHTVTVTGGSARIEGTVTGDLVVAGGSAHVEPGGRIVGNVSTIGGSVHLESGSRVDGDIGIVAGSLHRADGSVVVGHVVEEGSEDKPGKVSVQIDANGDTSTKVEPIGHRISEGVHAFGRRMTNMALLFVFGCVLLALATRRMDTLRVEAAAHPMRAFALGVVGTLLACIVLVIACVTIIGIPFAIMAVVLAIFATYGAVAAVLTTFGAALLHHKTQSPYIHLLFGCAVLLLVGVIPYIGGVATFALVMVSIGTLVSTRGGAAAPQSTPQLL